MGCCSSKSQLDTVQEHEPTRGNPAPNDHQVRQPTNSEKRAKAAEAAERRQSDWRQGGSSDATKAKSLRDRREKDELLGKIHNKYHTLGQDPPIGLGSCSVDQLRKHLDNMTK